MIENRQFIFDRAANIGRGSLRTVIEKRLGDTALRWYIARITDAEIVVEATVHQSAGDPAGSRSESGLAERGFYPGKSAVVHIIPTGVGCEFGGYAGDAAPITRLLAQTTDYVITNPNAVNASNFIDLRHNVLYAEGLCIDLFCRGQVDLYIPHANKVGIIIERTGSENLQKVYNVVNTVRAVHGVDIVDCVVTDGPIGSRSARNRSGCYVGTVDHPEEIEKAGEKLLQMGARAIAVTTNIQDLPHDEYVKHFAGQHPNPMGGVEAIISHLIVHRFRVPAAHAPMINLKELALYDGVVDARGAGEMASETGLACVLIGLARAPQISLERRPQVSDVINVHNLLAVVAPSGCMGGIPALYADASGIPIIAVRDNATVLDVTHDKVGLENVIEVGSYAEAAGILLALGSGLSIESITRPLATLRPAAAGADAVPKTIESPVLARSPVGAAVG